MPGGSHLCLLYMSAYMPDNIQICPIQRYSFRSYIYIYSLINISLLPHLFLILPKNFNWS